MTESVCLGMNKAQGLKGGGKPRPQQQDSVVVTTNSSSVLETEGNSSKTKSSKLPPHPTPQIRGASGQSLQARTLDNLNLTKASTTM